MPRHRASVVVILALVALATDAGGAFAHKMEVHAVLTPAANGSPTTITVEAWYEYGDAAEGTAIVTGPDGSTIAEAELDPESGTCTIPLPDPETGTYKITVDDGGGHREWVLLAVSVDQSSAISVQSVRRNRWLMGGIGLGVIAGGTFLARRLSRTASLNSTP